MPVQLVSDNRAQFNSYTFKDFTKMKGIKHPRLNGETCTNSKEKIKSVETSNGRCRKKATTVLGNYLSIPVTTKKLTQRELFLERRTRIELSKPNL